LVKACRGLVLDTGSLWLFFYYFFGGEILKLSKEAQVKMKEIQALESKYGLIIFRTAFGHLMDIGISNFDEESVQEGIKQILEQGEADKTEGRIPIMTPKFQCEILRCSAELAGFSIWTLLAYVKKHMVIEL
jgi:hypothetical protein